MSPTPTQVRNQRIDKLLKHAKEKNLIKNEMSIYLRLLRESKKLWPKVADPTLESYSKAAVRIILTEKNQ